MLYNMLLVHFQLIRSSETQGGRLKCVFISLNMIVERQTLHFLLLYFRSKYLWHWKMLREDFPYLLNRCSLKLCLKQSASVFLPQSVSWPLAHEHTPAVGLAWTHTCCRTQYTTDSCDSACRNGSTRVCRSVWRRDQC